MMQLRAGRTRTVFLTKRWAFKIPVVTHGWQYFLCGLLANMQERWLSSVTEDGPDAGKLCPVFFRCPLGFLIGMPRAIEFSDEDFAEWRPNYESFVSYANGLLPVEPKASSFGFLNGIVVAVDYGCTAQVFCVQKWYTPSDYLSD